jgi:hypothetical protein
VNAYTYKLPPTRCGIYHLLRRGQVVYIGQSVNVVARIASWLSTTWRGFDFDAWRFYPCAAADLNRLELEHIQQFDPPMNQAGRSTHFVGVARGRLPRAVVEAGSLDEYFAGLPALVGVTHVRAAGLAVPVDQILLTQGFPKPVHVREAIVQGQRRYFCRWRRDDVAAWFRQHGDPLMQDAA